MSYTINQYPQHALNDWANLIILAHRKQSKENRHLYIHAGSAGYELDKKVKFVPYSSEFMQQAFHHYFIYNGAGGQYYLPPPNGYHKPKISGSQVIDIFLNHAIKASHSDECVIKAVELLKLRFKERYYEGILGKIGLILNRAFGWYSFEDTTFSKKLNFIEKLVSKLPKMPEAKLPQIDEKISRHVLSEKIFTDSLRDQNAHGALCGFTYKNYKVRWMTPSEYLDNVDQHFSCHIDEGNMPWILNTMASIANGKSTTKFSPLMMNPNIKTKISDHYYIMEHEGRHRALAAKLLNIPYVPVAVELQGSQAETA